jgi:Ser/Thr protein kinase RdoA (MazF antagonist)
MARQEPAQPAGPHRRRPRSGDPNLGNYLWDGTGIRIVDFEDSGPSHRAFELAILAEHRSAWAESDLDAAAFAARFDLTSDELIAFREHRVGWRPCSG